MLAHLHLRTLFVPAFVDAGWPQAAVNAKYGQGAVEDYLKDPQVGPGVIDQTRLCLEVMSMRWVTYELDGPFYPPGAPQVIPSYTECGSCMMC